MLTRRDREERCILGLKTACGVVARKIGIQKIADQYGHGYSALRNNLNPELEERAPTLQQFEDILTAAAARGVAGPILDSVGHIAGCVFLPLPKVEATDYPELLESLSRLSARVGRLGRDVHEAIADGRVDDDEVAMLEKDLLDLFSAGHALVERAKQYGKK